VSRLDDLIRQYCADGVEFRALGEIAHYSDTRVSSDLLDNDTFVGVDNLLADKQGRTTATYRPNTATLTGFAPGDVLLGNIRPYLKKVWLADRAGGCSGDVLAIRRAQEYEDDVLPKFLYYVLSSERFFAYNNQNAKGAKMPRGSKDAILRYKFQVPALEVQREIVRVLDLFQSLEAELEAELEARRQQYDHYRDSLLAFAGNKGVHWAAMSDIGTIFGGLSGKSKADFSDGNARFVSYVNILNHLAVDLTADDFVKVGATERQRSLRRGDVLFTGSSETPLDVAMSSVVTGEVDEPIYLNSFSIGYRLHDPGILDADFAKHLFRSKEMRKKLVRTASGVTRFNVSKERLGAVHLPIPPIDEQRSIASTLDKFDALANDLRSGLPAEIRARRTQYEWYRDRLLTFKEVEA